MYLHRFQILLINRTWKFFKINLRKKVGFIDDVRKSVFLSDSLKSFRRMGKVFDRVRLN